jgi:AraC family transcriptional regulator
MQVWQGERPRTPRTVLARSGLAAQGLGFSFVSERIAAPTDWCFSEGHHVLVVHRDGLLTSMESEFSAGPTGRTLPRVGDVWVIPAEHRYAALAKGDTVGFCEITIPTTALPAAELTPRIGQLDPFLHRLTDRLAGMAGRDDAMSRLMRDSIAETARLHIIDHYATPGAPTSAARHLDASIRATLVEYLETNLDAEISLAAMAEYAEMTIADFGRAFSAAFGTTPHQFLIDRRINRAKTLLATGATSVTEISIAVGFSTPSHFATTFKQRVGVTPSAYRTAARP